MKYTNKWMVVPFNANYFDKSKDTISNQLTKALESSSNPIEKLNEYNQVLAKSKEHHHPIVPKPEEKNEDEEDKLDSSIFNKFSKEFSINNPNLFLPPPTVIPNYPLNSYTPKGKSKVPPPYPKSAKKTRGFTFYNKQGYLERPEYNEKSTESNPKKRKIIEIDKTFWDIYRK